MEWGPCPLGEDAGGALQRPIRLRYKAARLAVRLPAVAVPGRDVVGWRWGGLIGVA